MMKVRGRPNRIHPAWVLSTTISCRATNFDTRMQLPNANTRAKLQGHPRNIIPFTLYMCSIQGP